MLVSSNVTFCLTLRLIYFKWRSHCLIYNNAMFYLIDLCLIWRFICPSEGHGHTVAHWSILKSFFILLVSTVLMSLCADILTEHIQPLLRNSGISVVSLTDLFTRIPDQNEILPIFSWAQYSANFARFETVRTRGNTRMFDIQ